MVCWDFWNTYIKTNRYIFIKGIIIPCVLFKSSLKLHIFSDGGFKYIYNNIVVIHDNTYQSLT